MVFETFIRNGHVKVSIEEVTDRMQMRLKKHGDDYSIFECGIDIWETKFGKHIILTNLGIWGITFSEFARNYIQYNNKLSDFADMGELELIFCDDPAIDADGYDIPSNEIDDERLLK